MSLPERQLMRAGVVLIFDKVKGVRTPLSALTTDYWLLATAL